MTFASCFLKIKTLNNLVLNETELKDYGRYGIL